MTTNDPALTLYAHPLSSYCWKALIALYEAGTPFRIGLVEGLPKTHPAFVEQWPIGKMPLLHDAAADRVVGESSIIIEYLDQHYPGPAPLIPADPAAQLEARLWDRFFDLYVHTPMGKHVFDRLRPDDARDPVGVADAKATLDTAYAMLEKHLAGQSWAAGNAFTIADCAAMPALFYADVVHPFRRDYPILAGYFERLIERPSARRAIREAQPVFQYFPFNDRLDPRFTSPDF